MIGIDFDPAELSGDRARWWGQWNSKADVARQALEKRVAAGEEPNFRSDIWKALKEWMFENVFFKKCAYCEGKVTPQGFGHAEHWRPKSAVSQRLNGKLEEVEVGGAPHPGYWWLAYEWLNLLPACEQCNTGEGKGAQFPVAGKYARTPEECPTVDDLDAQEQPLLLHPLRGPDPAHHIGFDEFGQVYAIKESPQGEASIEVFNLDRPDLTEDRHTWIQRAEDTFLRAVNDVAREDCPLSEALDDLCHESSRYAAALRHHRQQWVEDLIGRLRR